MSSDVVVDPTGGRRFSGSFTASKEELVAALGYTLKEPKAAPSNEPPTARRGTSRAAKPRISRRGRVARNQARGDPSEPSGGDEPPLDGVTDSSVSPRACEVCGGTFTPRRRSNARLCGPACKQKAYRRRRADLKPLSVTLTPTVRVWLRAEIDRRTRERLKQEEARLRAEWELAA